MTHPTYLRIAAECGIAIPDELKQLIDSGRTCYPADFNARFTEILPQHPPALSACYDIEWLSAADISETLEEWLAPQYQHGNVFLPFAQSGAGDIFALIQLPEGNSGCGIVWHDREYSTIEYDSFHDFICAQFLDSMLDLSHLTDELNPAQAIACLQTDIRLTTPVLSAASTELLSTLSQREPQLREIKPAPRARSYQALSFINAEEHAAMIKSYKRAEPQRFAVRLRWEI